MKFGILGASGRMGLMIAHEILKNGNGTIAGAVDAHKPDHIGKDVGTLLGLDPAGITISSDTAALFKASDVVIDFTAPDAVIEHCAAAVSSQRALVVGTTGIDEVAEAALQTAAQKVPVLYSANMSLGVNLMAALVEKAATLLDDGYDIEIFEAHHRHKIDAPSGTALLLGHAAAKGRGVALKDALVPARYGNIGARVKGSIGMSVFRGGDVIGDHTVTFAGDGERLELSHKASDRRLFARGAIKAASWLAGKPPGLYTMRDVLQI